MIGASILIKNLFQKPKMRRLSKFVGAILILYILLAAMLYALQEKLIFLPTKLPLDYEYSFSHTFNEINITAHDGAVLNGIHFYHDQPNGVIIYFHGNAGNLVRWGDIVSSLVSKSYDVIVMDYRQYGKSTGKLSEGALYEDAQLFYNYALNHFQDKNITIYGRSLGSAIATKVASQNSPLQLILETPFYSLVDVASSRYPLLPIKKLLNYKFPSNEFMIDVACPIYIFHGSDDRIVPYASGKKLFDSITLKEKKFILIKDGNHNDLDSFEVYNREMEKILK